MSANDIKTLKDAVEEYKANLETYKTAKVQDSPLEKFISKTVNLKKGDEKHVETSEENKNHPLRGHISATVGGVPEDKSQTYLDFAGVVFDDQRYNFHIFPRDLSLYEKTNKENDPPQNGFLNNNYQAVKSDLSTKLKKLTGTKVSSGKCTFPRMKNIEEELEINSVEYNNNGIVTSNKVKIFNTYVALVKEEATYYIHLMRLTCKDGQVGCTLNEIQFHKECRRKKENGEYMASYYDINKGIDNSFDICYTETDKDSTDDVEINQYYKTNSAGNVCYNPPVKWPIKVNGNKIECDSGMIDEIIDWFRFFVETEDKKEKLKLKYKKQ